MTHIIIELLPYLFWGVLVVYMAKLLRGLYQEQEARMTDKQKGIVRQNGLPIDQARGHIRLEEYFQEL